MCDGHLQDTRVSKICPPPSRRLYVIGETSYMYEEREIRESCHSTSTLNMTRILIPVLSTTCGVALSRSLSRSGLGT